MWGEGAVSSEGTITARIGIERKNILKTIADRDYNGSITNVANAAIDQFMQEDAQQYGHFPEKVKNRVAFLLMLVRDGDPSIDWPLICKEVEDLWQRMQS